MTKNARFGLGSSLFGLALMFLAASCASTAVHATEPAKLPETTKAADTANDRYGLRSTHEKLVDNRGEGYENLYGVRNLRAVLADVAYRGGANNTYNRYGRRDNRNPLPTLGLENLCKDGFDTAIYLYSTNYETAPKKVDCVDRRTGAPNTLVYLQLSPYNEKSVREALSIVHQKATANDARGVYFHCWNGWHASGLISAYLLRQFCDVDGDAAVAYWDSNTDGNHHDPAFRKIRESILRFTPYSDLKLGAQEREALCLSVERRAPSGRR